jgi:hypothetical protein
VTGQPGQDNWGRTTGTRQPGPDSRNMIARTWQLWKYSWDRIAGTGQPGQDSWNNTARTRRIYLQLKKC